MNIDTRPDGLEFGNGPMGTLGPEGSVQERRRVSVPRSALGRESVLGAFKAKFESTSTRPPGKCTLCLQETFCLRSWSSGCSWQPVRYKPRIISTMAAATLLREHQQLVVGAYTHGR